MAGAVGAHPQIPIRHDERLSAGRAVQPRTVTIAPFRAVRTPPVGLEQAQAMRVFFIVLGCLGAAGLIGVACAPIKTIYKVGAAAALGIGGTLFFGAAYLHPMPQPGVDHVRDKRLNVAEVPVYSYEDATNRMCALHTQQIAKVRRDIATFPYLMVSKDFRHINLPNDVDITMEGLAWLAKQQADKHGLQNLLVLQTLEALPEQLARIAQEPNWRGALLLPTYGSSTLLGHTPLACAHRFDGRNPAADDLHRRKHDQHKLAIFVEKTGSDMRIVIWDNEFNPTRIDQVTKRNFTELDHVLHYLNQTNLRAVAPRFYAADLATQASYNGCETFALKNAVAFLRDTAFFQKIEQHGLDHPGRLGTLEDPFRVSNPPPEMMKGGQINQQIYRQQNTGRRFDLQQPLQNGRTLEQHWQRHQTQVEARGGAVQAWRATTRNKMIDRRVIKYQTQLIAAMEEDPDQVLEDLRAHLVVSTKNPQPI